MLTNDEDILENKLNFTRWYMATSSSNNVAYRNHAIELLGDLLDEKIPNSGIGCLYRFNSLEEYDQKLQEIFGLPDFAVANCADQNGRPKAALNKYRKYLADLEDGRVEEALENAPAENAPQQRRIAHHQPARIINCMDGLIDLLIGENAAEIADDNQRFKILAKHMISRTYFFKPETVNARHQAILQYFEMNSKIPTRMSTAGNVYQEEDGAAIRFADPLMANEVSSDRNIYMDCYGRRIRVLIDRDGNAMVRRLIEDVSGARVSQGTLRNNVKAAIISHIFGDAKNPVLFSNLWNLAIVPDYLNPILDKTENHQSADYFDRAVCYVKGAYKQFLYSLYDLDQKIADYDRIGMDIRSIFEGVHAIDIDETINVKELKFIEDQGFRI